MFSCCNRRRSLISRNVRLASVTLSKALAIFLIATFSPVSESFAEQTTPYAPLPMGLIGTYFSSISKRLRLRDGWEETGERGH
jgi:hypothetical protein